MNRSFLVLGINEGILRIALISTLEAYYDFVKALGIRPLQLLWAWMKESFVSLWSERARDWLSVTAVL